MSVHSVAIRHLGKTLIRFGPQARSCGSRSPVLPLAGYQQAPGKDSFSNRGAFQHTASSRRQLPVSAFDSASILLCNFHGQHLYLVHTANYSTGSGSKDSQSVKDVPTKKTDGADTTETAVEEVAEEKLSIFQRFKRAYKQHGKILVGVHVLTSCVWYGSFYAAARCGLDIVPWLEHWGFSETLIKPFRAGGLGDFALAYLLYKLATPARYTVTIAGTNLVIRHLRSAGKMAPKSQEDSIRQLYKEGSRKIKHSALRKERLKRIREAREKRKSDKWRKGKHF